MGLRRFVQVACLAFFLVLLGVAVFAAVPASLFLVPLDFFLRLDAALAAVTVLSGRIVLAAFVPAAIVVALAPFLGRAFCGWVCPMGTTLDGTDKMVGTPGTPPPALRRYRLAKYWVLAFMLGGAVLGVSFVFAATPLSLITRFYGLIVHPVLALFADGALVLVRPLAQAFDTNALLFANVAVPHFATQMFVLLFFAAVFAAARLAPRLWCSTLCPTGALLALFSRKPLVRRRVTTGCTGCGTCHETCPVGAIDADESTVTNHRECILCRTCQEACPRGAIVFLPGSEEQAAEPVPANPGFSAARRGFLTAGLTGVGTAAVGLTGLASPLSAPSEGSVAPVGLVRPPGAVPERDFLARCVRCGECMVACPYNALQPIWLKAGFLGLFSPELVARRGFCDPDCTRCGRVCPTDAIRELSPAERLWAKTGTAVIVRQKCLAWEFQEQCMVCDEVCPYDAVEFKDEPGNPQPVPHVIENKCSGCGYCEHYCPIQNEAAIVVVPMGELRLREGSYEEHGRSLGLKIALRPAGDYAPLPEGEGGTQPGPAPGFSPYTKEH